MDISSFALKNKTLIITCLIALVVGGIFAYGNMSKLEDPEIKVKVAVVAAIYPGASAHEVELEVTSPVEKAIRTMPSVGDIESRSSNDMAVITVSLKTTVPDEEFQQEWDLLRRKMNDLAPSLPPSARLMVMDDYGDVYGMFYAITGDGYEPRELSRYADLAVREISNMEGISKAMAYGKLQPCVNVYMAQDRMANLGVHPAEVLLTLNSQSSTVYSGYFESGDKRLRIGLDGELRNIEDLKNLIIRGHEKDLLKLSDVADIYYDYQKPVRNSMRYDSAPAIGLLISAEQGTDIIKLGKQVDRKLQEMQSTVLPAGIGFHKVFFQPEIVENAINTFIINLIESVAIVILLLMLTMGFRSGVIIAVSLIVIVFSSFFVLDMFDGTLQRVSLGSFIVAMGILVDNAIVIVDGILVDMKRGIPKPECLTNIGRKTAMPLLGATLIAILAFFPIFMSPDMAGSYVRDLFIVMAVSLLLSWILALTHVPIHAGYSLKAKAGDGTGDPFDTPLYRRFRKAIEFVLGYKWAAIGIAAVLVLASVWCYRYIPQMFFPDMSYDQLYIEYRMPDGTGRDKVESDLMEMEEYLRGNDNVNHITASIGGTPGRYCLVRAIADPSLSYGELIVSFHDADLMRKSIPELQKELTEMFPQAYVRVKQYNLMYSKYPIEAVFTGPDPAVLKSLAAQAKDIMEKNDATWLVTDNWSAMEPSVIIDYNQIEARMAGISRSDAGLSVLAASEGIPCGTITEGEDRLTVYIRSTGPDGMPVEDISDAPVWSMTPNLGGTDMTETLQAIQAGIITQEDIIGAIVSPVPLSTVSDGIRLEWEDYSICRRNGQRAIKAQCNNTSGYTAAQARDAILDEIEAIELPQGYSLSWLGEYNASRQSTQYLFKFFPVSIVLMLLIMIALFKDLKKPLIIILCLPVVAIGIVFGMLASGKGFGFVAIVGCLGIIGMMIKNGIVLIDEIDRRLGMGVESYKALVDSTLTRIRPVMMASMTTVLGMAPLLADPLFGSLAVTIMGGLTVGTVIILVFLPVLYSIFFRIKSKTS
ncbi:MAG TPA: efflux RND transporter permease subunit [Candidatus Coprenecus stercoripullorum]|nr:efflux RND transporter permease subunit [Candidatus Coprenecus stercoripullorum]